MTIFEKSRWAESDFSRNYREEAEIYLPFRSRFIETAISYYEYFVSPNRKVKILDLGCGDGLFVQELLKSFTPTEITILDGSQEMLDAAKKRLENRRDIRFIQTSFQDMIVHDPINEQFDFIHSSLAIHHISLHQKRQLYGYIFNHLAQQGHFIHYDVVVSPTEKLEQWYLALWKNWIQSQSASNNRESLLDIPDRYKRNRDNLPDTLTAQMDILQEIGFQNVDCYSKYGLFALFGGTK